MFKSNTFELGASPIISSLSVFQQDMLSSTLLTLHILFSVLSGAIFAQNAQQELVTIRARRKDAIIGGLSGYSQVANWCVDPCFSYTFSY